jgi:hypothetical protein
MAIFLRKTKNGKFCQASATANRAKNARNKGGS